MDLELDCLLETDEITDFLTNRLNEIKTINKNLTKSLNERKDIISALSQESKTLHAKNQIKVLPNCWKKIANNKYILGYPILNKNPEITLINVVANWDSALTSSFPNYKFYGIVTTRSKIEYTSTDFDLIAIVIDLPVFIEQLIYTVSGIIVCSLNKTNQIMFDLPQIELNSNDFTDNSILVQAHQLIDGRPDDFFAGILSCEKYEFDLVWLAHCGERIVMETLLELDCSLSRVNFGTDKRFYLVHKISPLFDGNLLEIEEGIGDGCLIRIYCRNEDALFGLVHYMHRHLIDAKIAPKVLLSRIDLHAANPISIKKSILDEIEATELRLLCGNKSDLIECKRDLSQMETATDLLVEMAKKCETTQSNSMDLY